MRWNIARRPRLAAAMWVATAAAAAILAMGGALRAQAASGSPAQPAPATRFEKDVLAYEAADRTSPPPRGAILLAGDSQFYRWTTLAEDLPEYTIVNRGIDGFRTSDLVRFAHRLVIPHAPRLIVLHVGGNDVNNGTSPEQVLADFQAFVATVRTALPEVPIAFSSITPSPGRWEQADARRAANRLVQAHVATSPRLHFIDLWDAFLGPDGLPREDLYGPDRIHPNHEGYLVRVRIMRPILDR